MRVLYALQLDDDILLLAKEDKLGKSLQDLSLKTRERATCSPLTVSRIEKGAPTVAIGIYLRVLYALQLDDDILWLAKEDKLGKAVKHTALANRFRLLRSVRLSLFGTRSTENRWHVQPPEPHSNSCASEPV